MCSSSSVPAFEQPKPQMVKRLPAAAIMDPCVREAEPVASELGAPEPGPPESEDDDDEPVVVAVTVRVPNLAAAMRGVSPLLS